jgi:hypothetical protein
MNDQLPDGCRPYSLPTSNFPSSLSTRSESRRASVAPKDLHTVGELEEDIAPSYWKSEAFAPIGAERKASISSWHSNDSDVFGNRNLQAERHLTTHKSASSLSTASSRYSGYSSDFQISPTQDTTALFSPFELGKVSKQTAEWQRDVGSTTLNFSIGRSIWC